jgi:hypothetical protein
VRAAAIQFANSMKRIKADQLESVVMPAIDAIKNNIIAVDEADFIMRDIMFNHFVRQEQFKEAAQTLAAVNVDNFSDHEKTDIYVKCAGKFARILFGPSPSILVSFSLLIVSYHFENYRGFP